MARRTMAGLGRPRHASNIDSWPAAATARGRWPEEAAPGAVPRRGHAPVRLLARAAGPRCAGHGRAGRGPTGPAGHEATATDRRNRAPPARTAPRPARAKGSLGQGRADGAGRRGKAGPARRSPRRAAQRHAATATRQRGHRGRRGPWRGRAGIQDTLAGLPDGHLQEAPLQPASAGSSDRRPSRGGVKLGQEWPAYPCWSGGGWSRADARIGLDGLPRHSSGTVVALYCAATRAMGALRPCCVPLPRGNALAPCNPLTAHCGAPPGAAAPPLRHAKG